MLWVLTARDTLTASLGLVRPMTRKHVGLLGPCFKMGRVDHRPTRRRRTALPQKRGTPRAGTGFQHVCSGYSPPVMGSACPEPAFRRDRPSACSELVFTLIAPLWDSLVRVSRRVGWINDLHTEEGLHCPREGALQERAPGSNMYALGTHRLRWGMQVPSLRSEGIGPQPA